MGRISRGLVALTLAAGPLAVLAQGGPMMSDEQMQQYMQQRGYGPGMMGSYGGYGMGPQMMGAYGHSGMGPWMMGGCGAYGIGPELMGPGMMMGLGMGMGPIWMLDLTDEQRSKIDAIYDDVRKKDWATMGKIMDEQAKLRDLYQADTPDAKKIGAVYGNIAKLRQQMIEANVDAQNRAQGILTKEQREQLQRWRRGMWRGGPMRPRGGQAGPGNGPGGMMGR